VSQPLFRAEAVTHRGEAVGDAGDVVRLDADWTRWAYWIVLALLLAGVTFALCASVRQYAAGPAVVRVEGKTIVSARGEGTVERLLVDPGRKVAAGDPLVEFSAEQEVAELARVDEELELLLLRVLRDPADQAARQALTSLRAQRDLASTRREQRIVRAPRAGLVSDVRVRPGQFVRTGEFLISLVDDSATLSLIALLPGQYRPFVKPGRKLRFELEGFQHQRISLDVDAVGDEVIGPAEAKRLLGPEVADAFELSGALFVVRAKIPRREFSSQGRQYSYSDGLRGRAEVWVRSERVSVLLVPALRALYEHVD